MFATLAAIAVIGLAVLIHELGHYAAARLLHIEVKEVSFGFGKEIWQHISRKTGIAYCIRLLPLGGYTEFLTEDDIVGKHAAPVALFDDQPVCKRLMTIAAGPLMNLLVALLLSLCLSVGGNLAECFAAHAEDICTIQTSASVKTNAFFQSVSSFSEALLYALQSPDHTIEFIGGIFSCIKIIADTIVCHGKDRMIELLITICVSLGVFNLMPIPGLDGSQIVMLLLEKARGKKLSDKWQRAYDRLSLSSIGILLCIMGYNDIKAFVLHFI